MPLACSTHALLVDIPMFAGPVVVLAGALWWTVRRERQAAGGRVTSPSQ